MALLLALVAILVWQCVTPFVIYFYDPNRLRRYPNQNLFSGLTSLAYVYERRHSFRTRELRLQHDKHPILRLSPTVLSFGSVEAVKDIYGHGSPCVKDDMYKLITGDHAHLLNVVDKDEHARKRRMLSNAFATRNLERPGDLTVNFRLWSNLFTLNSMQNGRIHYGGRVVFRFVGATDWFHILKSLTKLLSPHFRARADDFGNIVSMLTNKRVEKYHSADKLSDFLGCLIEDKGGKNRGLDRGEIDAEASILLDAGSDTTAIALTNVLYFLIKHPDVLDKLREEVATVLAEESVTPYRKVKSLPYLRACLDESLRLSPPIPRGLERKTPPQGMEIMGEHIAGDITVSVSAYIVHRDPTLFPKPDSYIPERWLDNSETAKDMRAAFIPFTTGPRACIGRNITMMEQQILIATLVHRYDFALPSHDWNLDWEEAFNLWPAQMPSKIWRRHVSE
ncbi:benzoate 4-monooxygenase cytochrome P450 [Aspergillus avenaceus]|uniref:Benzoate 4-monooxygenase cytochrome P450 n=1 Tax=Aspergillus avenaceus TaxID=36643 RepID=A0A5N6U3C1_ASPAV|nr:benzoate 4-monooxygenase cytochrome P450 [Aspergillus avenaceus]